VIGLAERLDALLANAPGKLMFADEQATIREAAELARRWEGAAVATFDGNASEWGDGKRKEVVLIGPSNATDHLYGQRVRIVREEG